MELKHHRDESKLVPLAHGALWRAPWTWIQPGLFLMLLALADHQGQLFPSNQRARDYLVGMQVHIFQKGGLVQQLLAMVHLSSTCDRVF
jgi:hypothetical protein